MKSFFLALFLFSVCLLQAQSPIENLQKYQTFRQRLCTDFMHDVQGAMRQASCLPMECRRVTPDGKVTAYWADGTWWLGHYVAVLATEYRRLQQEGQTEAAERSLEDLRRALCVYDRLDRMAELCWGRDTSTNGFYLRDDVPATYRDTFGVDEIHSDYARKCGDLNATANGPSQDQAWASYLGLALVNAVVDDVPLKQHASRIAERLLRAMQYTDAKGNESWQVVNPVTAAVMQPSSDIAWLKYAHAQAYHVLTGKSCTFGNALDSASRQIWQLIQQNFSLDKKGHYNWYGVLSLSAVINENPMDTGTTFDWLTDKCRKLSAMRPDLQQPLMFPHLPLINYLLYSQPKAKLPPDTLYERLLDAAPSEGGHYYAWMDSTGRTPAPWHSLSLFCPWQEAENSEFNMMDYLLLYNLYRIVYAPEKPEGMQLVKNLEVSIWPNPVGEKLYLHFPEDAGIRCCRLYGVDGRVLRQMEIISSGMEVDVSDLSPGFYYLRFSAGKQCLNVSKFIKK